MGTTRSNNVEELAKRAESAKKTANSGFAATSMCDEFNPAKIENKRFSKRGPFNEFRDPITVLIGLDVTASMGKIPKALLSGDLYNLIVDLKNTCNKPNENLQFSFAGIGDIEDSAPLQVTHFESDVRFADQLKNIWLEGGGGANGGESYNLLWWYAANKTHLNYIKEDNRKGILITIGDDNVHPDLSIRDIKKFLDPKYDAGEAKEISNEILVSAAQQQYEVFHIVITDDKSSYTYDNTIRSDKTKEQMAEEAKRWADLLGPKNVIYSNSKNVAKAIGDIIKGRRPLTKADMINLSEKEWLQKKKENLRDDEWEDVLTYTLCPLTHEYMKQPVVWNGGKRAYEQEAVEKYVQKNQKDPITGDKLTLSKLVVTTNLNIDQVCKMYKSFFDALPADRKKKLVKSALEQMGIKPKDNEDKSEIDPKAEKGAAANIGIFAPPKPSAQLPSASANPPNLGVAHLNVDSEGIPERYKCPIDGTVMTDPQNAKDGYTYNGPAIRRWLDGHNTSPMIRDLIIDKELVPNHPLRSEILEWQERQQRQASLAKANP